MPDNAREIFVKNLNEMMRKRGISQADIVRELGVTSASVSNWCTGVKYPRIDVMQKLADLLGIGLGELIAEDGLRSVEDRDRLEALHQNPRLGLLFDRQRDMSESDIEMMLGLAERIMKERDKD